MLLLGIDIGTSSVKISVVDAASSAIVAAGQYPESEAPIIARQPGWAEQEPESWWHFVEQALDRLRASSIVDMQAIGAIGISYQMHGLVLVDRDGHVLRPSIIWCDSRAVAIGERAFQELGTEWCLQHLLNSPGNFTASKLAWVKEHEPEVYARVHKILLPGDYIAYRLTGELSSSASSLSEGIFWDFAEEEVSGALLGYFGFDPALIPAIKPVFSIHGELQGDVAQRLGLKASIPVAYKAGDQPNNALSLNVLEPGEVAATAGTSGVIYAVTDERHFDPLSRVNGFAHVNHSDLQKELGVLLCINGTGILYRWIRDLAGNGNDYAKMNALAEQIPPGSEGLSILPFGNGAERVLQNKMPGAQISNVQFNRHGSAHLYRAAQEGIACAFRYGLDIMRENGLQPSVIRAGYANLFRSNLFTDLFVQCTGVPVELHANDGAAGAALGAGIGAGVFANAAAAFENTRPIQIIEPHVERAQYDSMYANWKDYLLASLEPVHILP